MVFGKSRCFLLVWVTRLPRFGQSRSSWFLRGFCCWGDASKCRIWVATPSTWLASSNCWSFFNIVWLARSEASEPRQNAHKLTLCDLLNIPNSILDWCNPKPSWTLKNNNRWKWACWLIQHPRHRKEYPHSAPTPHPIGRARLWATYAVHQPLYHFSSSIWIISQVPPHKSTNNKYSHWAIGHKFPGIDHKQEQVIKRTLLLTRSRHGGSGPKTNLEKQRSEWSHTTGWSNPEWPNIPQSKREREGQELINLWTWTISLTKWT